MARYTNTPKTSLKGINAELVKVQDAFEDVLDRRGDGANFLDTDLDMNSQRILNLPEPVYSQEPVRLGDVKAFIDETQTARDAAIEAAEEAQESSEEAERAAEQAADSAAAAKEVPEINRALLIAQGLSGEYGFFEEGFTYNEAGDVGIDSDGNIWSYNGSFPFEVDAGVSPSAPDYKVIDFNSVTAGDVDWGAYGTTSSEIASDISDNTEDLFYLNLTKEKEAGLLVVRPANGFFSVPASVEDGGGRGRLYNGAFNSLSSAMTFARTGDTIRVLSGGYKGNVIFKEGVKVVCEEGVVFYNSQFTVNNVKGFELLGYPKLVKTDMSVTLMTLTDCIDFNVELDSIEIWRLEGAIDIARSGFKSTRSGGDLKVRSNSFTLNKQYITIDDEWSNSGNVVNLHTAGNYSQRSAANSNNTDVQPIGILNGATVNWHVSGVQKSDLNNCIAVGYLTAPPSLMTTTLNIFSNSAIFEPSTGTFLVRGDSTNQLAVNEVTIQGVTRHKGSEFARDGNTDTTGSKLKIFGSVYSLNADTTFASTPVEAITVTAEA